MHTLIPFAPEWHRRKIRGICLKQYPVKTDGRKGLAQTCVFERYYSVDAEIEIPDHPDALNIDPGAPETVEHTLDRKSVV